MSKLIQRVSRLSNFRVIILIYILTSVANAGVTGKISGKITDGVTGEPLIGVNVVVAGTMLGAASDLDGHYTILFVPPGVQAIQATTIGYTRIDITDIRVFIDQNARVDFSLAPVSLLGESVIVSAERSIVRADVATSVTSLSGDEVNKLPVANVSEAIALQAGIEDGLVVRGGGAAELLFQVEGVTLRDARNNQPITGVPMSAIQELSIERGGFNAEYGQVRTGIVNVVSREGSKDVYEGSMTVKYGPPTPKHFGLSPYDENSMWMRPYLDNDVAWTGTDNGAWDIYKQEQYPDFAGWDAVSEQLLSDSDPNNDLSPLAAQKLFIWQHRRQPVVDQPDYSVDIGFGGPVPLISKQLGNLRFFASYRSLREMLLIPLSRDDYVDHDWMMVVSSDIKPGLKLKFIGMMGNSSNVAMNFDEASNSSTAYLRSPYQIASRTANSQITARIFTPSYYSVSDISHTMTALKLNHSLSAKTFYEASLERVSRKYLAGPLARRDTSRTTMLVDGYYVDEAPFGFSPLPEAGIGNEATDFFFGGHTATTRDSTVTSSTTLKFDLTTQLNFENLVKTGVELVYTDLQLSYGMVKEQFPDANNYVRMNQVPLRAAAYVQDKFEVKEFILNTGLRLDYSNGNTEWPSLIPFSDEWRDYNSASYNADSAYTVEQVKSRYSFSPRLAISHPITTNSKLFFNYGHFQQLPTYEEMFRLGRGTLGEMQNFGNPNLVLEKTVSYELGFDYSLMENYLFQIAGFYHDIMDQQAFTEFYSRNGIRFVQANNNSYEDIRGFEFSVRKTIGRWWTGFVNYTYQVSSSGHFGQAEIHENPTDQRYYDENTANLYQSKPIPQPFGRASVTLHTPNNFGGNLAGLSPLGGWAVNFLGHWRAGSEQRVAWVYPGAAAGSSSYLKYYDWYDVEARFRKTMSMGDRNLTFFVEVKNLLNTKHLSLVGFQNFHDRLGYFESLHLPESGDYNNIVGTDKIGEYRDPDIAYQPIEQQGMIVEGIDVGPEDVIYYGRYDDGESINDADYWEYVIDGNAGTWSKVASGRLAEILDDKAYIDMPNQTSFNFLNPRQIFIGVQISF